MATQHVFTVGSSLEETRPEIDYSMSDSRGVDWGRLGAILNGKLPLSEYRPVHIAVDNRFGEDWDFYRCSGTMGLISARAAGILSPYCSQCFDLMDAYINNCPYFFLRPTGAIDCLDCEQSILEVFPHDPDRIMWVDRYVFHKSVIPDPCIFVIPQGKFYIFGTDTIEQLIRGNKLRGFRLADAEAQEK